MDSTAQLAHVEELVLALDQNLTRVEKQLSELVPALTGDLQQFLAGRVYALAAEQRAESKTGIAEQCTAIRVEVAEKVERAMAAVLAKRQEIVGLNELEHTLKAFAADAAAQTLRQFAAAHETTLSASIRRELAAAPLGSTPGDPAAALSPLTYNVADCFRGQWTKDLVLQRGQLFTFRGSTYLCLKDGTRGILPTKQNQQGTAAIYALFAATGAPGRQGDTGATTLGTLVAFPGSATANGTAGQVSYQNGYMAYCYAANLWTFWPSTSDYPF